MQGMAVGRAVDLTRFATYGELYTKLEEIFGLEGGDISDKCRSALEVVFADDEDDIMVVGDDPWRYVVHFFFPEKVALEKKRPV
jgi:auxin response factor